MQSGSLGCGVVDMAETLRECMCVRMQVGDWHLVKSTRNS